MLRGDESWCQGFSEPEAGSDLGSLRTTAWSEMATSGSFEARSCGPVGPTMPHAASCWRAPKGPGVALEASAAFFVDMDRPGITVRPLDTMAGVDEFCETFFDDVRVPAGRLLGSQGGGWRVAQHILACDAGPIFWQRASWLLFHLGEPRMADASDVTAQRLIGLAFADVSALRSRSRSTQLQVAAGELRPAESSVDKILIRRGRSGGLRGGASCPARCHRTGRHPSGRPLP